MPLPGNKRYIVRVGALIRPRSGVQVKDKLKDNPKEAKLVRYTVRYIDDLLTLNNPAFEQEIPNIYSPQLVLKKTTETPNKLSYLDICIQIRRRKFIALYTIKGIHIVNFPYLDSNIPAYGTRLYRETPHTNN